MGIQNLEYPHEGYEKILRDMVEYYKGYPGVYAIALTGSLARGRAVRGSCIDIFIFLRRKQFDTLTSTIGKRAIAYAHLKGRICWHTNGVEGGIEFKEARVDIGFTDGNFHPNRKDSFDITRDEFETTIGNLLVYSIVLYEKGRFYENLKRKYLPFYDDDLRRARLRGSAAEFKYKIWKTRWLAERGEYLAAFDSLLEARRIFLQNLFIRNRKYPLDYSKWLKEQLSHILGAPTLYEELIGITDGIRMSEKGIIERSNLLEGIFIRYSAHVLPELLR